MYRTKEILDTMVNEYSATDNPKVCLKSIGQKLSESYHIEYVAGFLKIKADNPLSALYGWKKAIDAAKTGYIRECLGRHYPRFPLRAAWVKNDRDISTLCRQLVIAGFNAVVVCDDKHIETFKDYGLLVIGCGLDSDSLDALYVKSTAPYDEIPESLTRIEFIENDLKSWEEKVQDRKYMIFEVPYQGVGEKQWVSWLIHLSLVAGKKTMLAFSGCCPNLTWEAFRKQLDPIHTPLLPIIDFKNNWEEIFPKMTGHNFYGVVCQVNEFSNDLEIATRNLI